MVNINREERRRLPKSNEADKTAKKLKTWVKSWNLEQRKLFDKMVENEVDKIEKTTEIIVNDCYGAAINNFFEDMKVEEVNKILMNANDYMDEVQEFIKESKGEYWDMVENKELIKKAKARSLELMKARVIKSKALVMLKKEFKLPTKDLANIWTEVKEERGINISTTTLINGNEKMPVSEESPKKEEKKHTDKEIPKYAVGEIKANLMMEGEHGFEIAPIKIEPKELADNLIDGLKKEIKRQQKEEEEKLKEMPTDSIEETKTTVTPTGAQINGFKIKSIVLEGKFGTYTKDDEGIKLGDRVYTDIKELKDCRKNLDEEVEMHSNRINEKMQELTTQLNNLSKRKKEELEKYAEIEAVFQM